MWIMGFCVPMSVRSNMRRNTALPVVLWRIFVRSLKLIALGFFWSNAGKKSNGTAACSFSNWIVQRIV